MAPDDAPSGPAQLAIGDALPDVPLLTPAGETVGLASLVQTRPAVLVLMRHLGCLPCREHLLEVSRRRAEFGDPACCA